MGCEDMKCIGPMAKDADLWILIWEEVHTVHQEGMLVRQSASLQEGEAAHISLRQVHHGGQ